MAGLGVGPPCLRVDIRGNVNDRDMLPSEPKWLVQDSSVTQMDSSDGGIDTPGTAMQLFSSRRVAWWIVLRNRMPDIRNGCEYTIQESAVIWEPLEQMRDVVSDEVDSVDSFGMAKWDAGGSPPAMSLTLRCETFRTC